MHLISLEKRNGVPLFVSNTADMAYARVYGNTLDPMKRRYEFPAYAPFGLTVVSDLQKVASRAVFSREAHEQVELLKRHEEARAKGELPAGFEFATKPFDHQRAGLSDLIHTYRYALFWDPGVGKSKVIVDYFRAVGGPLLIITPNVTVLNWAQQFELHAPADNVRVGIFLGTPKKKLKVLEHHQEFDVIVSSYDAVRGYAFPRIYASTLRLVEDAERAGRTLSVSTKVELLKQVRRLSQPKMQHDFVLSWAFGTPVAELGRCVDAAVQCLPPQWLCDVPFKTVVADEAQNLSTHNSDKTKASIALARSIPRRYIMTGTPSNGEPTHVYGQMRFLAGGVISEDYLGFCDKYLVKSPYNKHVVVGYKNLDVLNARINRVASIKKKEDCLDLPERTVIDVPVQLSNQQISVYNQLVREMEVNLSHYFESGDMVDAQNAAVLVNKLAQISGGFVTESQRDTRICDNCPRLVKCVDDGTMPYTSRCAVSTKPPPGKTVYFKDNPKLEALDNLLDPLLRLKEHKVIVWCLYKAELDQLETYLQSKSLGYVRMDGQVTGNRQTLIDKFNNDEDCRVYLGQVQTGVGITLNAAAYMVYYTLPWSLGDYLQSIDRNYRAGQLKKTFVYRLVGAHSIDVFKIAALNAKEDLSRTLTKRTSCVSCERSARCLQEQIEPFEKGCIYIRGMKRPTAKAKEIPVHEADSGEE